MKQRIVIKKPFKYVRENLQEFCFCTNCISFHLIDKNICRDCGSTLNKDLRRIQVIIRDYETYFRSDRLIQEAKDLVSIAIDVYEFDNELSEPEKKGYGWKTSSSTVYSKPSSLESLRAPRPHLTRPREVEFVPYRSEEVEEQSIPRPMENTSPVDRAREVMEEEINPPTPTTGREEVDRARAGLTRVAREGIARWREERVSNPVEEAPNPGTDRPAGFYTQSGNTITVQDEQGNNLGEVRVDTERDEESPITPDDRRWARDALREAFQEGETGRRGGFQ